MTGRAVSGLGDHRASDAQTSFLATLFIDCGFHTRVQRNAWLSSEIGREIRYMDDLTVAEASKMIDALKEMRDEKRSGA